MSNLPITVGAPHKLIEGGERFPIVRGDGRVVFVETDSGGASRFLTFAKIDGTIRAQYGDPVSFEAAVIVAKAFLRGME